MVTVKDICSSSTNAFCTGLNTLGSGAKKGFHLICLSKPQNTWGRYAVQTARALYIAQTVISLGLVGGLIYSTKPKNRPTLWEYITLSSICLIPGGLFYKILTDD